jgi:hypothetical protein
MLSRSMTRTTRIRELVGALFAAPPTARASLLRCLAVALKTLILLIDELLMPQLEHQQRPKLVWVVSPPIRVLFNKLVDGFSREVPAA